MINLLPKSQKKEILAGRSNVLLMRYNILTFVIISMLAIAVAVTYFFLNRGEQSATTTITDNTQKAQRYENIKIQAENFRSQLTEAKSIFDGDTAYSQAILAIANSVPQGVALSSLKLDEASFAQPMILQAKVKGEQSALSLRNSFQGSKHFSNVSFGLLTKSNDPNYPYSIELNVTFNKASLK